MNRAEVSASTTSAVVSNGHTRVTLRDVPVETLYYWLSPWQSVGVTQEVKP